MSEEVRCCGQPMWFVEVQGVYDGALYLMCVVCSSTRHRFPEGHPLLAVAATYVQTDVQLPGAVRGTT